MNKGERILYLIMSLAVMAYVGVRIWLNPLINDEAYTYIYYILSDRFLPLLNTIFDSANNHPLNSLLAWISTNLFGINEVSLRLPNFLALAGFLFFGYRLGAGIRDTIIRWLFFIVLFVSPPLLEFFGFARGYGLSLFLLSGSLYHLQSAATQKTLYKDWKSWAYMVLAILANLNLLACFLAWLLFYFIQTTRQQKIPQLLIQLTWRSLPLLYFIAIGLELKKAGQLYYGTKYGLIESLNSLLVLFVDHVSPMWKWVLLVLVLTLCIYAIVSWIFTQFKEVSYLVIFGFVLTLSIAVALGQSLIFDTLWPIQRAIIHWYFLIVVTLFFMLDHWSKSGAWMARICGILLLPITFLSFSDYKLSRSADPSWSEQQLSESIFEELVDYQEATGQPLLVESNILFLKHTWDFLNIKHGNPLNELQFRPDVFENSKCEALIFAKEDRKKIPGNYRINQCSGQHCLAFRTDSLVKTKLAHINLRPKDSRAYWIPLSHWEAYNNLSAPLRVSFKLEIMAQGFPANLAVLLKWKDQNEKSLMEHDIQIDNFVKEDGVTHSFVVSKTIYELAPQISQVEIGLLNPFSAEIDIRSAECSIFKLE